MLFELILICYLSSGAVIDNLGDWTLKKITGIDKGAMVEISRKVGDGHKLEVPKWCAVVKQAKAHSDWQSLYSNDTITIEEGTDIIFYDHPVQ